MNLDLIDKALKRCPVLDESGARLRIQPGVAYSVWWYYGKPSPRAVSDLDARNAMITAWVER